MLAVNGTATGSGKGEDEKKKDDKSGDGKIYTAALRLGGIFGPRDNFVTAQWEGLSPAIGTYGTVATRHCTARHGTVRAGCAFLNSFPPPSERHSARPGEAACAGYAHDQGQRDLDQTNHCTHRLVS